MQQFDFDKDGLKKRISFIWILTAASVPCIFLVMLLTTNIMPVVLLAASGVSTVLIVGLAAVQTRLINKSMGAMKVLVEDDRIVKRYAGGEQSLTWDDIASVDVKENPRGECAHIKIRGKDRDEIHLFGFERMREIADTIAENTSAEVALETRRGKLDHESPIWGILGGAAALVAITVGRVRGAHIDDLFEFVFSGAVAFYLLVYRPMTKHNPGWKRYETLCGVCMTLVAINKLIEMFTA